MAIHDQPGKRNRVDDYLGVAEVAELFHVSTKTVVRWANDGKLPHMATLGGHRRFPRSEMEAVAASLRRHC